jgi:hypothetical protein
VSTFLSQTYSLATTIQMSSILLGSPATQWWARTSGTTCPLRLILMHENLDTNPGHLIVAWLEDQEIGVHKQYSRWRCDLADVLQRCAPTDTRRRVDTRIDSRREDRPVARSSRVLGSRPIPGTGDASETSHEGCHLACGLRLRLGCRRPRGFTRHKQPGKLIWPTQTPCAQNSVQHPPPSQSLRPRPDGRTGQEHLEEEHP